MYNYGSTMNPILNRQFTFGSICSSFETHPTPLKRSLKRCMDVQITTYVCDVPCGCVS